MGTPSISTFLHHFYGTKKERNRIGILTNHIKFKEDLLSYLNGEWKPGNTREIIKKYYSWDFIMNKNLTIYERLSKKYYE